MPQLGLPGAAGLRFSWPEFCIPRIANPHPFNTFRNHSNYLLNKH